MKNKFWSPARIMSVMVLVYVIFLNPFDIIYGFQNFRSLLWLLPYVVYAVVASLWNNTGAAVGGGLVMLVPGLIGRLFPGFYAGIGSGVASRLLVSLPVRMFIELPAGMAAGWFVGGKLASGEPSVDAQADKPHPFRWAGRAVSLTLSFAVLFHVVSMLQALLSPLSWLMVAWMLVPYGIGYLLNKVFTDKLLMFISLVSVLLVDMFASVSVIFFPTSSTSAIGLIFLPIILVCAVLPAGLLLGWIVSLIAVRISGIPISGEGAARAKKIFLAVLVVLFVLGAVKYKAVRHNLLKMVDVNEDIGDARVVVGADRFRKVEAVRSSGWLQYDIYDSSRGPELAVVGSREIRFLSPSTYNEVKTVPFSGRWSWMDKLISIKHDGKLAVLHGGGGYSDIGLADDAGHSLWTFRPDPTLPPEALISADLDADKVNEFYAIDMKNVYRLDVSGKTVWTSPPGGNHLLYIPKTERHAAILVSDTLSGEIVFRDLSGSVIKRFKPQAEPYMLQAVRWGDDYCLAMGQTSGSGSGVFITDLDGKIIFRQHIGKHFGVNDILAVRFNPGEEQYLVVLGGGGSGVRLTELNIFDHSGKLVYKELGRFGGLMSIPDGKTGADVFLMGGLRLEKI